MQRELPGTREIKGREFMYIESPKGESFHEMTSKMENVYPEAVIPRFGGAGPSLIPQLSGAGAEGVRIELKNGITFMGISYKGDTKGWRARFVGLCEASKRKYGFIKESRIFLSDGSSFSVQELKICERS